MAQRDYSGHYQSGHSSASGYGSSSSQQQNSQPTLTPQYDLAGMGQITYQADPYDLTGQYSGGDDSNRPNRGQSRSLSHGTGTSTSGNLRRREQNRLAQRALRQRRESHVRELEHQVLHRSLETRHLAVENRELSQHLSTVTQENDLLRYQQVASGRSAEAWLQTGHTGTVPAGYSPYAQQAHTSPYDASAAFYSHSHSPHSSTSDPTPMRTPDWNYNDTADPTLYDRSFAWGGHATAQTGAYEEQYEEDEDDEEEKVLGWPQQRR